MAETNLQRGEALPLPNSAATDASSELEEPIYLVLQTGQTLHNSVALPEA